MAGLDPAIQEIPAPFASMVPVYINIINSVIAQFSVIVDGRHKAGHDEKPKGAGRE